MGGRAFPSGPAGAGGDELAPRLGIGADRRAGIPRAFERRSQRQRHQRPADGKADPPVRGAKRGGLAVVRAGPELRQREAAARADRQRPPRRGASAAGAGARPADAALAGDRADPRRPLRADRLGRVLSSRRRAGPFRPATDRGAGHGIGLRRSLRGDPGSLLAR